MDSPDLAKIRSPDEEIIGSPDTTLMDFWKWAYSDVMSNRNRSIFAEFIIANALGVTREPRIEWDAVDLKYRNIAIEVKSAAYLQSWKQKTLSIIRFGIEKKLSWESSTNTSSPDPIHSADCYVFCLFHQKDPVDANVLDLNQWSFYIARTDEMEKRYGDLKSLSLSRLEHHYQPIPYSDIRKTIDGLFL